MKNNKIMVTACIRDSEANEIGTITDNHWWIPTNPLRVKDKNFNKNTLEIIGPKGNVIFQIRVDGNKVYIAGYFYNQESKLPTSFLNWMHDSKVKSLFKYPSSDYPGVLFEVNESLWQE
jgi:hypothetical protein